MIYEFISPYLEPLMGLALPGGAFAVFMIILILLTVIFQVSLMAVLWVITRVVGRTKTTLDDRIVAAVRHYFPPAAFITGLYIALEAVYPDITIGGFSELDVYIVLMVTLLGIAVSGVLDAVLLWYGMEIQPRKRKVAEKQVFPFVRNVVKILVLIVIAIFILQKMGVDTTAIITGLGVGGLAVALALQDTLSNFFGGVHLLVDKPFRENDYIKVNGATEGTVDRIGWRTTKLFTPARNEIIIPNSKLSNAIIENFNSPKENSGVYYTIGVDYEEDIEKVEKILKESLQKVAKKNELMISDTIWLRFDSFGDFSLNFKFGYQVKGYTNRWGVWRDVAHEIYYSFKKAGISIPFPVMSIEQRGPPKPAGRKRKAG